MANLVVVTLWVVVLIVTATALVDPAAIAGARSAPAAAMSTAAPMRVRVIISIVFPPFAPVYPHRSSGGPCRRAPAGAGSYRRDQGEVAVEQGRVAAHGEPPGSGPGSGARAARVQRTTAAGYRAPVPSGRRGHAGISARPRSFRADRATHRTARRRRSTRWFGRRSRCRTSGPRARR